MTAFMPDTGFALDVFPEELHTQLRTTYSSMNEVAVAVTLVPEWEDQTVFTRDALVVALADQVHEHAVVDGLGGLREKGLVVPATRSAEFMCTQFCEVGMVAWDMYAGLRQAVEQRFEIELPRL